VHVSLASENGEVRVAVKDDGVGFDTESGPVSAHGLLGMRYRLETEGGRLTVKSKPGEGTLIEAHLPESGEETAGASAASIST
jgi:signal transduction histidine kinase